MKRIFFFNFISLFSLQGYSQTLDFNLASPQPNLVEVYEGSFASGDVDGDGDKDLLITGQSPQRVTKLYLNDGTGIFVETSTILTNASSTVSILKDLDNDGDLDLFLSGNSNVGVIFTNIYRNNGGGVFTQVNNPALPLFKGGGAAIDDVDNDGDQDIVISTKTSTNAFVADVYLNNGNAVYTAQGSTTFTAVEYSAIAFIDIENDGDKDVIISGNDVNDVSSIKLYQNNGSGIFTLNISSTFAAVAGEDIDVADTDNDGDLDFLVNGNTQNLLYTNNGSGIFTQTATNLQQTQAGKNAFADLDNDGDQDLLIVGSQNGGFPNIFNIVYQNTGNNVFIPADTLGGEYIADCVLEDFTGDGLKDIIIQGFADNTNVYWNSSANLGISNSGNSNLEVNLYPNPTNDLVNFNSNEKIESISLVNLLGQEVFSEKVNSSNYSIDLSNLIEGTYIAKLTIKGKTQSLKLVKM